MLKYFITICFFLLWFCISRAQVLVSNTPGTPQPGAQLDVSATDKGLLMPRMNSTARNNIASPANGLLVYDTDTKSQWFYATQFSRWIQIIDSTKDMWSQNADVVYNKVNAQIGIGTSTPQGNVSIHNSTAAPSLRFTNTATGTTSTNGTELKLLIDELVVKNNETFNTDFITDGATRMTISGSTGNIGIGTAAPTSPLSFANTTSDKINLANVSATEAYGIGVAPATLQIHAAGSADEIQLGIGKSGPSFTKLFSVEPPFSTVRLTNKLTRSFTTGSNNLLPVAYGRINSNGTIANTGTENFTLIKSATGVYQVRLTEPGVATQPSLYTVIITPLNYTPAFTTGGTCCSESTVYHNISFSGPDIVVKMFEYFVGTTDIICPSCIGSLVKQVLNTYLATDCGFSFMVYKSQ